MKIRIYLFLILIMVSGGISITLSIYLLLNGTFPSKEAEKTIVANFEECRRAGYPIMESYPEQCMTPDGRNFVSSTITPSQSEILPTTNATTSSDELHDLIVVDSITPNTLIENPLRLSGKARGMWFFEASFPIELRDSDGNLLGQAIAQAQSDWMTTEFVSFNGILSWATSTTKSGVLLLKKDNPSGLPEHDRTLIIPVVFSE